MNTKNSVLLVSLSFLLLPLAAMDDVDDGDKPRPSIDETRGGAASGLHIVESGASGRATPPTPASMVAGGAAVTGTVGPSSTRPPASLTHSNVAAHSGDSTNCLAGCLSWLNKRTWKPIRDKFAYYDIPLWMAGAACCLCGLCVGSAVCYANGDCDCCKCECEGGDGGSSVSLDSIGGKKKKGGSCWGKKGGKGGGGKGFGGGRGRR